MKILFDFKKYKENLDNFSEEEVKNEYYNNFYSWKFILKSSKYRLFFSLIGYLVLIFFSQRLIKNPLNYINIIDKKIVEKLFSFNFNYMFFQHLVYTLLLLVIAIMIYYKKIVFEKKFMYCYKILEEKFNLKIEEDYE